jgi:glycosyltransferase involved in cell wall biosynthesis
MERPLISVVIPVFNEEERIERCLRSMQKQTYANLEIIVVDDGSTDQTPTLIKEIAAKDPRVSYYKNPQVPKRTNWRGYDINAGFAARNYGFERAKGVWITTQDADDASLLNRIEVQYELAKKYSATLVTVTARRLEPELLDKKLDTEQMFKEIGGEKLVVHPEEIVAQAKHNRGILMREPFHKVIPFSIKWFPYTRKLFYKNTAPYPGADNCMFFSRSVLEAGLRFRPRGERTWGTPSGRGSGRDFCFMVALRLKNSWSFRLPLYLWNVKNEELTYPEYRKYLV